MPGAPKTRQTYDLPVSFDESSQFGWDMVGLQFLEIAGQQIARPEDADFTPGVVATQLATDLRVLKPHAEQPIAMALGDPSFGNNALMTWCFDLDRLNAFGGDKTQEHSQHNSTA